MATISELLQNAATALEHSPSAALDAEVLLCTVLHCNRAHLYAWPDKAIDAEQEARFGELLAQRAQGTPVAHLTGEREFWSLDFSVTADTLIPRPETELLVEQVLQQFNDDPLELLDLGTGSGAIAISLAHERPRWRVTASDVSAACIAVARVNAAHHRVANLRLLQSDWFEQLGDARFDVIVSNPPYIANSDPHLARGDVRFEPMSALASGDEGMDAICHLCRQAPGHLVAGGWLFIEHGHEQKAMVRRCFEANGFVHIRQFDDAGGRPRLSAAQAGPG